MAKEIKRTIETILNLETGEILDVQDIFRDPLKREAEIFQLRSQIQQQVHQKRAVYVCIFCKQSIGIRGHVNRKDYYLAHTFRSDDCIIKTNHHLTEEQIRCVKYNGEKESVLHNHLKNQIAHYLELDDKVIAVHTEKVYKDLAISKEWKKPDVMAELTDKKIAFELQLSTTFLSVIVGRTIFYRDRGIFLIWIFPNFSLDSHLQQFTQKDVYYNNSFNVYVFDEDAQEKSKKENRLVLKCYYKCFTIKNNNIQEKWVSAFIGIDELNYDTEKMELFFYDSIKEKEILTKLLAEQKAEQAITDQKNAATYKASHALKYLREFYRNDVEPIPRSVEFPLQYIETEQEIEILNKEVGFNGLKVKVISDLFQSGEKPNFLQFVCEQDNLLVDTKNMVVDGKPIFEYLIYLESQWEFYKKISLLFRKGYTLSNVDYGYFHNLYDKNYFNATESERDYIERWAFIYCLNALWNKEDSLYLMQIKKILFAILSLKKDLSIGHKFGNLKQLTMNILTHSTDFGMIYINALKKFDQYDRQLLADKSGKLKAKIDDFKRAEPLQNSQFDRIIYEIFPEL
ncbi:MAG: DUF6035 family protein [Pedobacter sp.]|jgi:competence CoiA-like predicted nuclease|uniref:DUF6035 family protein n=1 Tax=Pedobacter sp. TaxID=1411316 RepID=UPI00356A30AC